MPHDQIQESILKTAIAKEQVALCSHEWCSDIDDARGGAANASYAIVYGLTLYCHALFDYV